ncbi:hypothetical protein Taiwan63_12950 [Helicobacter pylori]
MLYSTLTAKFVFWEKTWKKLKPRFFVDWENLLTDLRAIQKNPKTDKRFKEPDFSFNNPE